MDSGSKLEILVILLKGTEVPSSPQAPLMIHCVLETRV